MMTSSFLFRGKEQVALAEDVGVVNPFIVITASIYQHAVSIRSCRFGQFQKDALQLS